MKLAAAVTGLLLFYLMLVPSVQGMEKLKCATSGNFSPLNFMQDKRLVGIDVDQFKQATQRLNLAVDLIVLPFTRILIQMEEGALDCMFAAFKTPDREVYMDFSSVPIHVSSLVFFEKEGSNITFNSLEDIKGLTVGLVRGFKTSAEFDDAVDQGLFKVEFVSDIEQNFQKLSFGRLDLVLVNGHVGGNILKRLNLANISPLPNPLIAQPAYLTFSKKSDLSHLVPLFDHELTKAKQDGSYQKIIDRYIAK